MRSSEAQNDCVTDRVIFEDSSLLLGPSSASQSVTGASGDNNEWRPVLHCEDARLEYVELDELEESSVRDFRAMLMHWALFILFNLSAFSGGRRRFDLSIEFGCKFREVDNL